MSSARKFQRNEQLLWTRILLSLNTECTNSISVGKFFSLVFFGLLAIAIAIVIGPGLSMAAESAISILPSGVVPASKVVEQQQPPAVALRMRLLPGPDKASISLELINDGSQAVHVLRDGTPFDDAPGGDVLEIVPAGKSGLHPQVAPYIGPVYRRLEPDASRFLEVPAAGSLRADIKVTQDYQIHFDGRFRIRYSGVLVTLTDNDMRSRSKISDKATSWVPEANSVELYLEAVPLLVQTRALQPQYDNCSAGQQNAINTATLNAEAMITESMQSLASTPVGNRPTSPRYTRWFGFYTAPNYEFVSTVVNRISSVLSSEVITYRCSPPGCSSSSTVAYVQPFLREDINLCPLFFDGQITDDYRAGTVIHELSHLLRLGNTDDLAYGSSASATLAQNSPVDALANADNFTLFAVNNDPALPMIDDGSPIEPVAEVPVNDGNGSGLNISPLLAGETVRNTRLAEGSIDGYSVTDVAALEMTSLSGDADLYVYNSLEVSEDSLVCVSQEFSRDSVLDRCPITGDGEHFVFVLGYTQASYELKAVPRARQETSVAEGAIALSSGQIVSDTLTELDVNIYTAVMPARLVLTSLTGDADLYVFSDSSLAEDALICRSIAETPQDVCELPGTGRVHIGVLGYAQSNSYELFVQTITSSQEPSSGVPSNDDPVVAVASSSGGGALGLLGLLILSGFVWVKRWSAGIHSAWYCR